MTSVDATTSARPGDFVSMDPSTGAVVEVYPAIDDRELETRLQRAAEGARSWADAGVAERARVLVTAAELLEGELPDIAYVMTKEMGKTFAQAKGEVAKCAQTLRWYAEHGPLMLADEPVATAASSSRVRLEPLGPVLAVMPWNFPLWQVVRFAAPSLLAGNVVLLKHAPNVPRCAMLLEFLFQRAGAPSGTFQQLMIGTERVAPVISDPRVAGVTLTGSVRAGRSVAAVAGQAGKKAVLELGGSDPFLVLASADLDRAVPTAVQARMQNNGQSCIAAKRFLVHADVYDEFLGRFVEQVAALRVGDPLEPDSEVGPVVSAAAADGLIRQVSDAFAKGATVHCGGSRLFGDDGTMLPGFYVQPTVLSGITPAMDVFGEEVFGPVASLYRVSDTAGAIELANATEFGLGASVWTSDPAEADRCVAGIRAGQVFVNAMVASMPELPFGGVKASGHGRELGEYGVREFCNVKSVFQA